MSQDVCPYNIKFSRDLAEPAFAPREALADKDARRLAREVLGMERREFGAAFRGSPMKRAKLRGLKRNSAVVLGNVGTAGDVDARVRGRLEPRALGQPVDVAYFDGGRRG